MISEITSIRHKTANQWLSFEANFKALKADAPIHCRVNTATFFSPDMVIEDRPFYFSI